MRIKIVTCHPSRKSCSAYHAKHIVSHTCAANGTRDARCAAQRAQCKEYRAKYAVNPRLAAKTISERQKEGYIHMKPIYVTRSSMPPLDEYVGEIRDLWDSRVLTNSGVKYQELAERLEEYLGVGNISMFCNGHMGLEIAFEALGLDHGEAITTPFTFASTTQAIIRAGMTPVFADVKPEDFTLDPVKIEALITERTVAIVPVHVYGQICDYRAIEEIAKRHHLRVVYDAAHAFGVTVDGRGAGTLGDVSMFSFHATKVFHTIEGGALTYADPALTPVINAWRNFGLTGPETAEYVGGNAKMTEFSAAMGLCNLRHVDEEIAKRGRADARYRERLSGVRGIYFPAIKENVKPNYAYFPVVFDGYRYNRDEIAEKLKAENIFARKYFYPLTSQFDCHRGKPYYGAETTPVARHTSENVLTLPMFADLSPEDVDRIADIILG